jgi:hypothetical protein
MKTAPALMERSAIRASERAALRPRLGVTSRRSIRPTFCNEILPLANDNVAYIITA